MNRLLIALSMTACTATVRTAGPPPAEPMPPPPAPAPAPAPAPMPAPTPAAAPMPPPQGQHPAYLHALSDLRAARGYLMSRPKENVEARWDEKRAINRINDSIKEINDAAINDGKPIDDHPPVDAGMVWGSRLQKSLELVESARRDVNEAEDNGFAKGLKARALKSIDQAAVALRDGMEDAKAHPAPAPGPGPAANAHPAYATALGNLRHARALLERPAGFAPDVKWDEHQAVREIDSAIKEVHDARQDDGMPLTEHPPIASTLVYADRLREADRILDAAAKDLEEHEDNGWAKKDRKNAIEHTRHADKLVKEAMLDRKTDKVEKKEEKKEEKRDEKADKKHGH